MIQANELRVGNWIDLGGQRNYYKVKDEEYGCLNLNGIPITKDILLKCGFRKDEDISYRWYFDFGWAVIIAYDLDDNCVRIGDSWDFSKVIYVHELQNLIFALTKTELTINL